MADNLFRIGTDLETDFDLLTTQLANMQKPITPDWTFQPYATVVRLGSGKTRGQGFPIAKWRWNFMSNTNREILREFCPDLAADIYIYTPTNETTTGVKTWKAFQGVMNWTPEEESKAGRVTLGLLLIFTHLEEVEYS